MQNTNEEMQLKAVAEEIRDYQLKHGLSAAALCKEFAGVGSSKTYKRILDGDFEQMDVDRQLHNYREAAVLVEMRDASGQDEEKDYDDLKHVNSARLAIMDALKEKGNNRLVIIGGASGMGKSTLLRLLMKRWPNISILAEANDIWMSSQPTMLADLLTAVNPIERGALSGGETGLGAAEVVIPYTTGARKQKLFKALEKRKIILWIDEGHHMGVQGLNLVKSLINQTPIVVVVLTIPTLFRRLETAAYEEARQLTKNRMCERVTLSAPQADEVLTFMDRRGVTFTDGKVGESCAKLLATRSANYGNWNFVNMVSRKARRLAAGKELDQEGFVEALTAVEKTR